MALEKGENKKLLMYHLLCRFTEMYIIAVHF